MPKATIKSETGAVITIEGSQEEVTKIIADYERCNSMVNIKEPSDAAQKLNKDKARPEGASGLVVGLRESGFFDTPKTLADVEQSLQESGFLYPTTTLSGVVLRLV